MKQRGWAEIEQLTLDALKKHNVAHLQVELKTYLEMVREVREIRESARREVREVRESTYEPDYSLVSATPVRVLVYVLVYKFERFEQGTLKVGGFGLFSQWLVDRYFLSTVLSWS